MNNLLFDIGIIFTSCNNFSNIQVEDELIEYIGDQKR